MTKESLWTTAPFLLTNPAARRTAAATLSKDTTTTTTLSGNSTATSYQNDQEEFIIAHIEQTESREKKFDTNNMIR